MIDKEYTEYNRGFQDGIHAEHTELMKKIKELEKEIERFKDVLKDASSSIQAKIKSCDGKDNEIKQLKSKLKQQRKKIESIKPKLLVEKDEDGIGYVAPKHMGDKIIDELISKKEVLNLLKDDDNEERD